VSPELDYTAIIIAFLGLLTTGGLWQYLQNKSKLNHEARVNDNAANLEFRASLKAQVELLNAKVDKLVSEKEELMLEMAKIQMQLAEANITIMHLEESIRNRR
jgi:peptidoglycan hydrolase CwlO-like protein